MRCCSGQMLWSTAPLSYSPFLTSVQSQKSCAAAPGPELNNCGGSGRLWFAKTACLQPASRFGSYSRTTLMKGLKTAEHTLRFTVLQLTTLCLRPVRR